MDCARELNRGRCADMWVSPQGYSLWKPTTIQTSLVIYILQEPMLFMSCLLTYRFQCQLLFHTDTTIHNVLPYLHSKHSYFALLHSQDFFDHTPTLLVMLSCFIPFVVTQSCKTAMLACQLCTYKRQLNSNHGGTLIIQETKQKNTYQ